jgi:hypothetical protein
MILDRLGFFTSQVVRFAGQYVLAMVRPMRSFATTTYGKASGATTHDGSGDSISGGL